MSDAKQPAPPTTDPAAAPVILITAGTAGVGAAAARLFARAGWRVVANYKTDTARAQALQRELATAGPPPVVLQADLGSRPAVRQLVADAAAAAGGRLDAVFSNGGWTRGRDLADLDDNVDDDDWDRCFDLNVKSHLWLLHAARPFLERAEGAFVTTASLAGVTVSGSSMAYSVTKAAQIHLVKTMAAAVAPKIRVNSVSPGLMMTDWVANIPQEVVDRAKAKSKLGRVTDVEDVAAQVMTFVKSKSITGTNAIIDAGFSL